MRRSRPSLTLVCAAALAAVTAAPVRAAGPRDELLRYVPGDVGFCLVVQGLREKLADVQGSPLGRGWGKLVPAVAGAAEWKQLGEVEAYLKKNLGVGWADLRDDLLGDAFAFAYRPGPAGKPEKEQGLFLVRARDGKKLAGLVEKLNALQKQTGELKDLAGREHKGVKYVRREEAKGQANYYLLRGPVLLFTAQEGMLRGAIEAEKALGAGEAAPLARRLKDLKLDGALVALAVSPRAWDDAMGEKARDAAGKTWARCWKALQAVGVGLHVEEAVRLEVTVQAKGEALPAPARALFAAAGKAGELWGNVPDDALFAAGGRVDLGALYELLGLFLTQGTRGQFETELERGLGAVLGKDVIKEVLPALGPDWGVWVTAPPAEGGVWAPRVVAACKVARGGGDDPVDEAVVAGVTTWAQLLVLAHNKKGPEKPVRLRTQSQGGVKVRYLDGEGAFPPGVQPAYALKLGYLVVGSSPAEVKAFKGAGKAPGAGVPLVRVSLKAWREYLKGRREPLAAALARSDGTTREVAAGKLDALRAGLELVDRVELHQTAGKDRVTFTLTVTPGQPITKARP